jgi:hypothetical protein
MSENTNADAEADANVTADDTEGHRQAYWDKAPEVLRANDDDDDDTEGHRQAYWDKAPGVSGALNTDPKTQS